MSIYPSRAKAAKKSVSGGSRHDWHPHNSQFAFTRLEQPQVLSLIHPENSASIREAEQLGEPE